MVVLNAALCASFVRWVDGNKALNGGVASLSSGRCRRRYARVHALAPPPAKDSSPRANRERKAEIQHVNDRSTRCLMRGCHLDGVQLR